MRYLRFRKTVLSSTKALAHYFNSPLTKWVVNVSGDEV